MKFRLSRRSVLRGAGASVALPWLEAMTPLGRQAQAARPKRFIVFFTPNGSIRENWVPTGTETEFTLSRILAPLEKHKASLAVLDGVDNIAATKGAGDDHQRGMGCMLTGTELLPGTQKGGCSTCPPAGLAGGISVDQEIVAKTKPNTLFPSLELGVLAESAGTVWGYSSYRGPNQPLPLDNKPRSVFERIFGDVAIAGEDNTAVFQRRQDRKSVLDAVNRNYKLLNPRLGADDRQKLESHLTTVQELERRLTAAGTTTISAPGCKRPVPSMLNGTGNDNFPAIGKAQMDLLAMAFACDLTRTATLQWSNAVGGVRFSWIGATRGHHDISHDPDTNLESKEWLTKINVWYSEQLAYLIDKLKAIPEEGGTVFDNTAILWVNELAKGNAHSHPDMPFVLAGSAGGRIKTGRWLKYGANVSHNDLLVSILNAYDVPATRFGNPAYSKGPLPGLLV